MEDNEYDEYGNYVGGKDPTDSFSGREEDESSFDSHSYKSSRSSCSIAEDSVEDLEEQDDVGLDRSGNLILQEKSNNHVIQSDGAFYGEGVEMVIAEEDNQPISKPLFFDTSSTVTRYFAAENLSVKVFRRDGYCQGSQTGKFMQQIVQEFPHRMRTVAFLGHLHHGKTSLCTCLIMDSEHPRKPSNQCRTHFNGLLDTRRLEHDKKMSMTVHPFSTIAKSSAHASNYGIKKSHLSYVLNGIDCPGHTNFEDEALAGVGIVDGAILVVDVAEGMRNGSFRALDQIIRRNMPFVVLLNKLDRLILEFHLPPTDAYLKLYHIVHEINQYIIDSSQNFDHHPVSPCDGSVIFGSTKESWFFSLDTFATLYETTGDWIRMDKESFVNQLWGNWRYNETRNVIKKDTMFATESDECDLFTFVKFILEPIYKIYSTVLSKDAIEVNSILGITPQLTPEEQSMKLQELFPICVHRFLSTSRSVLNIGHCSAISTAIMRHIDDAETYGKRQIFQSSTAPQGMALAKIMKFLQFPIQKRIRGEQVSRSPIFEADLFYPLVRITHGHLSVGMKCNLTEMNLEIDFCHEQKQMKTFVLDAMYLIDPLHGLVYTPQAAQGAMVCLRGFTESELQSEFPFMKEGMLYASTSDETECPSSVEIEPYVIQNTMFPSLALQRLRRNQCVVKVGVEPVNSAVDYGNLLYAIRCVEYMHPGLKSIREETGERILLALGELSMDTILFEIREVFGRSSRENLHGARFSEPHVITDIQPEIGVLQIRVSDPFVRFAETLSRESLHPVDRDLKLFGADSGNELNRRNDRLRISFMADPLSKKMQSDFSAGIFQEARLAQGNDGMYQALRRRHEWDAFDIKNLWCFGPHPTYGPNVLLNEASLTHEDSSSSDSNASDDNSDVDEISNPSEPKESQLDLLRDNFTEGFRWAMMEGPLCGEPVQGVAVRLIQTQLHGIDFSDSIELARLQRAIVSGTRQCVTNCLLESQPCLLEPIYTLDIESTHAARGVVYALISKRRGKVMKEERRVGSVLYALTAEVPVLDSFGLETEIRVESAGEAFAESRYTGWDIVPGGPAAEILAEIDRHPSYSLASADVDTEPVPPRKLTEDIILKIRRRKGMFTEI